MDFAPSRIWFAGLGSGCSVGPQFRYGSRCHAEPNLFDSVCQLAYQLLAAVHCLGGNRHTTIGHHNMADPLSLPQGLLD